MFCQNCGMKNQDGVMFCQSCGAQLDNVQQAAPMGDVQQGWGQPPMQEGWGQPPVQPVPEKKKSIAPVAIGGAAVVVVLLLLLGGGGYKKAIKGLFKAIEKPDAEAVINYVVPKEVQEEYFEVMEEYTDMDKDEYIDEMNDGLEDLEIKKIKYEIKAAENLNKLDKLEDEAEDYFDVSDLDDFKDSMEDRYDDTDFDADKIKEAYIVKLKVEIEADDDEKETMYDIVYKYKGDWYFASGFDVM